MVEAIRRMKLKLCVVGDRGVGKTCLINRYVFNTFSDVYEGTLGSRLCLLTFKEVLAMDQLVEAEVALFDLMGERGLRDAFREVMFWGTHGFLAVADLTRRETVRSLPSWIRVVTSVAGDIPFRILMNKADLAGQAIPPEETVFLMSELPGIPFQLTSAKTGEGVGRAFDALVDAVVGRGLAKSRMRRQTKIVGDKILLFARRRGIIGVGKRELLAAFKEVQPNILMREVEDLHQLGLVAIDQIGPDSFRLKLTEKGEREVDSLTRAERVIEEA